MDRISDLPDVLLQDILLRLRSPHAAARTSVLSSRWTPYMAILNTEMPCLCTKYVTHIEEMQRYKKVYSEEYISIPIVASSITKHGIQLADHRFHQLRAT
ncbi:hypothetical protein EJB05_11882, partial [Eragrostis curvula]